MTSQSAKAAVSTIGIDIGKNTFHLVGMDASGAIVLRQKVSRGQLEKRSCRRAWSAWKPASGRTS